MLFLNTKSQNFLFHPKQQFIHMKKQQIIIAVPYVANDYFV